MKNSTFLFCMILSFITTVGYSQNAANLKVPVKYEYHDETLSISIANPFQAPIRVLISTPDPVLDAVLKKKGPLLLAEKQDTLLQFERIQNKPSLNFKILFGDPSRETSISAMALPFPVGKSYHVIQANFGTFSHRTIDSKYAIDFNLKVADTVCASDDGFVIGIVKHHQSGGNHIRYYDQANYITIYHPQSNVFSQYVHLMQDGIMVTVGQFIAKGQAIGLSGATGYTAGPHLHFNVYKANMTGWESTPCIFEGGNAGINIRRGQNLRRR